MKDITLPPSIIAQWKCKRTFLFLIIPMDKIIFPKIFGKIKGIIEIYYIGEINMS
jgi:hypothetical protein